MLWLENIRPEELEWEYLWWARDEDIDPRVFPKHFSLYVLYVPGWTNPTGAQEEMWHKEEKKEPGLATKAGKKNS